MSHRNQFAIVFLCAAIVASVVSHCGVATTTAFTMAWDVIRFGSQDAPKLVDVVGSSLIWRMNWKKITAQLPIHVEGIFVPFGSPAESEFLLDTLNPADTLVVEVTLGNQDDDLLAESRSRIVPVSRSIRDLTQSRASLRLAKRVLTSYPLRYVQIPYPTAGRSILTMHTIRLVVDRLRHTHHDDDLARMPSEVDDESTVQDIKLTSWDRGKIYKSLDYMWSGSDGHHSFFGPKHEALKRLCETATKRGTCVVVVMPDSPLYTQDLSSASSRAEFKKSLEEIARQFPAIKWIRLDEMEALKSNDLFTDLVHLNYAGSKIATAEFCRQFAPLLPPK